MMGQAISVMHRCNMIVRAVSFLLVLISFPAVAAETVTLALDWTISGVHAGYFVALEKGYYRDAGLDVTISRGFGSGDTVKRVGSGSASFGIADTGTIIAARANEDVPVRIIAMVYQKATVGLIYLTESGIKSPKDLVGRTIGRGASGASVTMFPAFLKANGVQRDSIKEVVVDATAFLPLLMSGQVDAVLEQSILAGRFKTNAAQRGKTAVAMPYADFGLDLYGNAIIANPKLLEANPMAARAFVNASLKGIAYALAHPDEAVNILRTRNPEIDADIAKDEVRAMSDIAVTNEVRTKGLGSMDESKLTRTRDVVTDALALKRNVPIDQIYSTAYLPTTPIIPAK